MRYFLRISLILFVISSINIQKGYSQSDFEEYECEFMPGKAYPIKISQDEDLIFWIEAKPLDKNADRGGLKITGDKERMALKDLIGQALIEYQQLSKETGATEETAEASASVDMASENIFQQVGKETKSNSKKDISEASIKLNIPAQRISAFWKNESGWGFDNEVYPSVTFERKESKGKMWNLLVIHSGKLKNMFDAQHTSKGFCIPFSSEQEIENFLMKLDTKNAQLALK